MYMYISYMFENKIPFHLSFKVIDGKWRGWTPY